MAFPLLPDLGADQLEQHLLETWKSEDLFRQSMEAGRGGAPFVFFAPTSSASCGVSFSIPRGPIDPRRTSPNFMRSSGMTSFNILLALCSRSQVVRG